jgi:hypothetical protein
MLCPWVKCPGAVRPMSSCCAWTHPDLWTLRCGLSHCSLTAHSSCSVVPGEWDSIWASWLQPDGKKTCFLEFWPCNSVAYLELRQTVLNLFSITVSSIATCCQHKSTIIYWFSKSPRTCVNVCNARSSHISMAGGKDSLNENCMNCMILNMQREHLQLKQLLHFNITPLKIWLFANFILQAVRVLKDMIRCALQCLTVPAMESIDMETVMQRPNQDHSDPTLVAMVRIPAHLCSWKQVKAFK